MHGKSWKTEIFRALHFNYFPRTICKKKIITASFFSRELWMLVSIATMQRFYWRFHWMFGLYLPVLQNSRSWNFQHWSWGVMENSWKFILDKMYEHWFVYKYQCNYFTKSSSLVAVRFWPNRTRRGRRSSVRNANSVARISVKVSYIRWSTLTLFVIIRRHLRSLLIVNIRLYH